MTMVARVIAQAQLDQMLEQLIAGGLRLVAPVRRDGRLRFDTVTSVEQIAVAPGVPETPPKELLFPGTEAVLRYRQVGDRLEVRGIEPEVAETVLFGARPCDAAALTILGEVFNDEPRDSFFLQRLEATTVVTVSCSEPQPQCFCSATGYGPGAGNGSDLLLTEIADGAYFAEVVTDRGGALVERFAGLFSSDPTADKGPAVQAATAGLARTKSLTDVGPQLRELLFVDRQTTIGQTCLGCGACAFSCPTCHCFDLIDQGGAEQGTRLKVWDCCAFKTFTVHASGHNPRPSQLTRYRQRVMHKLSYFPERFGHLMCVGCGRCLRSCPVGQDIYEVAAAVAGADDRPVSEG
jgi:ferredoxin